MQVTRSSASPGQERRKGEVTAFCPWSLTELCFLTLTCVGEGGRYLGSEGEEKSGIKFEQLNPKLDESKDETAVGNEREVK